MAKKYYFENDEVRERFENIEVVARCRYLGLFIEIFRDKDNDEFAGGFVKEKNFEKVFPEHVNKDDFIEVEEFDIIEMVNRRKHEQADDEKIS